MVNLLVLLSVGLWVASLFAARLGAAVITHCVIADNMMQCVMIVKRFFVFLRLHHRNSRSIESKNPQAVFVDDETSRLAPDGMYIAGGITCGRGKKAVADCPPACRGL
jgi:hypothetical protein